MGQCKLYKACDLVVSLDNLERQVNITMYVVNDLHSVYKVTVHPWLLCKVIFAVFKQLVDHPSVQGAFVG